MAKPISRRAVLQNSGMALSASIFAPSATLPAEARDFPFRLSLNENALGPSPRVVPAIQRELGRINRYADSALAQEFSRQVAAYERVAVEQVVLGEILGMLGQYLSTRGGPGGEFIYSTPGYLALIDAAAEFGGIGVAVPLDAQYRNDLAVLHSKLNSKTRAVYLINPHNPTGTVSNNAEFKSFLREAAKQAVVIVDEAYLEYTPDFQARSAVSLVHEGANVMVFRTFDKIHGLAGMPIGYVLAPITLASALRERGAGDAEGLGRLNLVAAGAALGDTIHVEQVRATIAKERDIWLALLRELNLPHTKAEANFVFFDAGRPQQETAVALLAKGVDIGRAHPPYTNWARITIGRPEENRVAQSALRGLLSAKSRS